VNPAVKLAICLIYMVSLTLVFDLRLLCLWALIAIFTLIAGARLGPVQVLKGSLPFLFFGFGFLWANILFPAGGTFNDGPVMSFGFLKVHPSQALFGLTMAFRAVIFGLFSLVFSSTTDPMDFAVSLMRQARLSSSAAFSVLAVHRFLPLLEGDLANIRAAHRLRGLSLEGGLKNRWERTRRYTVPLFAGVIRRAGRVAMAMEARGLGNGPRTFRRDVRVLPRDLIFAGGAAVLLLITLVLAGRFGWDRIWKGNL
jgi:energy-coupling factor transporter transmembrane protein EcfT